MRQFEIGLLFGPPIVWIPEFLHFDGEFFDGFSVTWLFVALMVRIYAPESPSGASAGSVR